MRPEPTPADEEEEDDLLHQALDEDGDDDADDEAPAIMVRRASSVEGWEMFRLGPADGASSASIAVRSPEGLDRRVEVAVWRPRDVEEPGATSHVDRRDPSAPWDDAAREDVIRQVLYRYEEDLGVSEPQVAFAWSEDDEAAGADDDDDSSGGPAVSAPVLPAVLP